MATLIKSRLRLAYMLLTPISLHTAPSPDLIKPYPGQGSSGGNDRESRGSMSEGSSKNRPSAMFVLGLAPKKIGGIEKFLRSFVLAMDARGWDTILCFDGSISDDFRRYVEFPFVRIESLNNQGNLGLGCAKELWRLVRRYRPKTFLYAFHGVMRCFPWIARLGRSRDVS